MVPVLPIKFTPGYGLVDHRDLDVIIASCRMRFGDAKDFKLVINVMIGMDCTW